jgi:cytochrome c-type biogenesis protein CcmF
MTPDQSVPFSPIAVVGTITLLVAYLIAAWSITAGIAGNARRSRRLVTSSVYALHGFTALVSLASALIVYAFVTHDYSIKYVAATSDTSMSTWYKVTAFWGGLDGSLLFWVLVLGLFSSVAIAVNHKRHRDMIGYVVATIMVVQLFFLSLLVFGKDPFATYLTQAPADGQGLNPLLQNYWMVIHPPSLYIGFVAATIPFAFGVGALASGRLDDLWLGSVRSWMLICFGFLSLGLILGGRWAYEELGWGGYWAWDPVENAGLLPWFTATAFLHSSIIQEQRGMMKKWNLALVVLTFFLTIFGTFMTRSGVVQSVHAFGEDNELALQFIVFMAVILVVSVGLIVYRSNKLSGKMEFDSFYSREFAFLLNNWILLACAFFVLFATMFPTISEALDGSRISVGPEFFNKWMTPFGLALLFLSGAAPLLAWRKTTQERLIHQFAFPTGLMVATVVVLLIVFPQTTTKTAIFADQLALPISLINFGLCAFVIGSIGQEFWRGTAVRIRQTGSDGMTSLVGLVLAKRRKYGGYIVHLGVAVTFIGFAGKAYEQMIDRTIEQPAATVNLDGPSAFAFGGYTFTYEDLIHTSDDNKDAITARVGIFRHGERIATVFPAKWDYHKGEDATTEVAIRVRFTEDVYVILTGYDLEARLANFRVYVNPLILWVWIGFLILGLGTLICLIPQRLADYVAGKPRTTRLGRAADAGILLAVVCGAVLGIASQAQAAGPGGATAGLEHVPAGQGMGQAGGGWAAKHRPDSPTAEKAMKELICPCGCARQDIHGCDCKTASDLRAKVLTLLAMKDDGGQPLYDLNTADGRKRGYDAVLAVFVAEYGEIVLATPRSKFSWLLPALAAVGALGLLAVVGRRWIRRGEDGAAEAAATPEAKAVDEKYADRLDDELAETD